MEDARRQWQPLFQARGQRLRLLEVLQWEMGMLRPAHPFDHRKLSPRSQRSICSNRMLDSMVPSHQLVVTPTHELGLVQLTLEASRNSKRPHTPLDLPCRTEASHRNSSSNSTTCNMLVLLQDLAHLLSRVSMALLPHNPSNTHSSSSSINNTNNTNNKAHIGSPCRLNSVDHRKHNRHQWALGNHLLLTSFPLRSSSSS